MALARTPAVLIDLETHSSGHQGLRSDAVALLHAMREASRDERAARCGDPFKDHRIDLRRTAKVIALDGPRGSGKTTLLLLVKSDFRPIERVDGEVGVDRGIHFLPGLDLDTLAPAVPLPLHVLQCLYDAVSKISTLAGAVGAAEPEELERVWDATVDAYALGWKTNVGFQAPNLDAIEYAWSLQTAARRNAGQDGSFTKLMDTIVVRYESVTKVKCPLFVVSIDDADMHPDRSAELLHLVREMWHPSLAFIVAGEAEMFLTGLRRSYMQRIALSGVPGGMFNAGQHDALVAALALEAYDKSVPFTHRLALPTIPAADRLEWCQREIKASGVHLPRDVQRLLTLDPTLAEALPPYPRELQRVTADIASRARQRTLSHREFSSILWHAAYVREPIIRAMQLGEHPTALPTEVLATDIVSFVDAEDPKGNGSMICASPVRFQPDHKTKKLSPLSPTSFAKTDSRAYAAFSLFVACHIDDIGPQDTAIEGMVLSRVPKTLTSLLHSSLVDDRPLYVEMNSDSSIRISRLVTCALIMLNRERERLPLAVRRLLAAISTTQAKSNDTSWHVILHQHRANLNERLLLAATLASCPEAGLGEADANELLREVQQGVPAEVLHRLRDPLRTARTARALDAITRHQEVPRNRIGDFERTAMGWLSSIDEASPTFDSVRWLSGAMDDDNELVSEFIRSLPFDPVPGLLYAAWGDGSGSGLQRYFTWSRMKRIVGHRGDTLVEVEHFRALQGAIQQLEKGRGATFIQLRQMWQSVGAPPFKNEQGGAAARFTLDGVSLRSGLASYGAYSESSSPIFIVHRENCVATFYSLSPAPIIFESGPLSEVQQAVFTVIRDIEQDMKDRPSSGLYVARPVEVQGPLGEVGVSWTTPNLLAPIDSERIAVAWNEAVRQLPTIEKGYDIEADAEIEESATEPRWLLDDLMVALLQTILNVATHRLSVSGYRHDFRPISIQITEVSARLSRLDEGMLAVEGERTRLCRDFFVNTARLWCLPEYGLTESTASLLWGALLPLAERYPELAMTRAEAWQRRAEALKMEQDQLRHFALLTLDRYANWPAVRWLNSGE